LKHARARFEVIFDVDRKLARHAELESIAARDGFWESPEKAEPILKERKSIDTFLEKWGSLDASFGDLHACLDLVDEQADPGLESEIGSILRTISERLDDLEMARMLSGEGDDLNAIVTIHAGAGGTESQDWAEMLLRMYTRFCDRNGYEMELAERQDGEEAGIKSVTFLMKGDHAFGYMKAEGGVHRLVRISPFDANKRRHTSFASVFVSPEIDDTVEITIDDNDLRIDTLRSGGAGGQHVNKTESAVRLTHLPTGLVVLCQQERSQHKNKALAYKILRSKMYALEMRQRAEKVQDSHKAKKDIAWGSQIRSYVLAPYRMVKDHRTGHETGNVDAVLDGDIMDFIHKYLLSGGADVQDSGGDIE
jgi:peptide chain release factor 2